MTMTPEQIQQLEQEAAAAAEVAAAARAAAVEAQRAEQERQDARRLEDARWTISNYDAEQLEADLRAAIDRFGQVLIASELGQAWLAVMMAAQRKYDRFHEAKHAASRVDRRLVEQHPWVGGGPRIADWLNPAVMLTPVLTQEYERLRAVEEAEREQAREAWIAGHGPHPLDQGGPAVAPAVQDVPSANWSARPGAASGPDAAMSPRRSRRRP